MRVLAVAHAVDQLARVQKPFAERLVIERRRQVLRNRSVVARGVRVRLGREAPAPFERQRITGNRCQHGLVVVRVNHNRYAVVVLGCGADHCRPADIDILDRILDRGVAARNRLFERVQVDDQQIDWLDTVLVHDALIGTAAAQQAAMNDRMKRLDSAVHNFRKTGFLRDLDDIEAGFAQLPARSAG